METKTEVKEWHLGHHRSEEEMFTVWEGDLKVVEAYERYLAKQVIEDHNLRMADQKKIKALVEAAKELLRVDADWHGSVNSEMAQARINIRQAIQQAGE